MISGRAIQKAVGLGPKKQTLNGRMATSDVPLGTLGPAGLGSLTGPATCPGQLTGTVCPSGGSPPPPYSVSPRKGALGHPQTGAFQTLPGVRLGPKSMWGEQAQDSPSLPGLGWRTGKEEGP